MNALIIVDMQVGCFAGEPPRRDADRVVERINALAAAFRNANDLVIHIRHTDPDDGYAPDSPGWQFLSSMQVEDGDEIVEKSACDAFLETRLKDLLDGKGITEVVIVGCATDFCVDTTVRAAGAHGYRVTVASDAHTTRDRPHLDAVGIIAHHHFMWNDLILPRGARIHIVPTETILDALLQH